MDLFMCYGIVSRQDSIVVYPPSSAMKCPEVLIYWIIMNLHLGIYHKHTEGLTLVN